MSYNTKDYTGQGGEKTVIGGTLEFGPESKVVNFPEASKTIMSWLRRKILINGEFTIYRIISTL